MIMTDQDHDGSHIKGLIINFIHCYWPALLKHHDFVREFVTPIVKVSKARHSLSFFTLKEYADWRLAQAAPNSWAIKYYKGLGTSTSVEAKQYFSNLPLHELTFTWSGPERRAARTTPTLYLASPCLASPCVTPPHLAAPCLASPHLTSPRLISSHLISPHLTSLHLISSHLILS